MKKEQMKVCMLTTSFPRWKGDPSTPFVYGICKRLVKKGIKVDVVAPHDIDTKKFENIDGINIYRFQYFFPRSLQKVAYGSGGIPENLKKGFFVKIQLPFFMIFFFLKALKVSKDSDVINAQWAPSGIVANLIKKLRQKKVVLYIHGASIFVNYARWIVKSAIVNADFILFNSSYTKDKTLEICTPKKLEIIPWGINTEKYSPNVKFGSIRKKYKIPKESPLIFCLGRLVERKGFDILIRAMNAVEQNAIVIIGGEGPKKEEWKNLAENLNLKNRIIFAGGIPGKELPYYYKDCDIFILPAIIDTKGDTEGLGIVILEAMATGKPVIGSAVGGIVDIIDDGKNGYLVKQKNPDDITDKINYLIKAPSVREALGIAGRKKIENQFSWDKVVERTIDVYAQVLEK